MNVTMIVVLLLVLAGCATSTNSKSVDYAYSEQDRINQFVDYKNSCLSKGGVIVVTARSQRLRDGVPGRADGYRCQRNGLRGLGYLR